MLLRKGASKSCQDQDGRKPFDIASSVDYIRNFTSVKHGEIMKLFLEDEQSYESLDFVEGQCAIVTAVAGNNLDSLKVLLERGADPNHIYESAEGVPLLHLALQFKHTDVVKLLIDHGSLIDVKDASGIDALGKCNDLGDASLVREIFKYMKRNDKRQDQEEAR